jgi:hypothetical protein
MTHRRRLLGPFPSDSKENKAVSTKKMRKEKGFIFKTEQNLRSLEYNDRIKEEVLAHYGFDGNLQCSYLGCQIKDPAMLTLDHVNNDGAEDRLRGRRWTGVPLYAILKRECYPKDFATLCCNHQNKKELEKRRTLALTKATLSYLIPFMYVGSYGKDLQCQTQV